MPQIKHFAHEYRCVTVVYPLCIETAYFHALLSTFLMWTTGNDATYTGKSFQWKHSCGKTSLKQFQDDREKRKFWFNWRGRINSRHWTWNIQDSLGDGDESATARFSKRRPDSRTASLRDADRSNQSRLYTASTASCHFRNQPPFIFKNLQSVNKILNVIFLYLSR